MVRPPKFRALCKALGDVEERPHFDRSAFRTPERTFTTLGPTGKEANVLLPLELQEMLVDARPESFVRLNGAWGARGWTRMVLTSVDETTCRDVLREAHSLARESKPKKAKARPTPERRAPARHRVT